MTLAAASQFAISLENISRRFSRYAATENVTIGVGQGRFISIVGPSGCGKSTVLNIVAGSLAPTSGNVEILGERLTGINRHASYMFQQDALLPWKTTLEDIQPGLNHPRPEPGPTPRPKRPSGLIARG